MGRSIYGKHQLVFARRFNSSFNDQTLLTKKERPHTMAMPSNMPPKKELSATPTAMYKDLLTAAVVLLFVLSVVAVSRVTQAAEGASSHYLPGANIDIFLALPPEPGFLVANTFWYQSGNVGEAVLEGQVELNLDINTFLNLTALTYTFEQPILGGRYTVGALIPFGNVDLDSTIIGPRGGRFRTSESSFDLSDIALIPFQLNWASGPWSFKVSEVIVAPTGGYSLSENVNLGRNYWSFDTIAAVTWFDPEKGTEVSLQPGLMINTENSDTDYQTGTEFHLDLTLNQFLSPSFAVGIRGYWYQQISGDSGAGALLGDYKSDAFGAGPGFVWIPKFGDGQLTVLSKWIHDFSAKNPFDSDYLTLTVSWKF